MSTSRNQGRKRSVDNLLRVVLSQKRTKQGKSVVPQQGPAARYLQNIELQEEVGQASRAVEKQEREIEALKSQLGEVNVPGRFTKAKSLIKRSWKSALIILLCLTVAVLTTIVFVSTPQRQVPSPDNLYSLQLPLTQGKNGETFLNVGVRQDSQLRDCQSPLRKKSFPNLDYAFLGYDILKGYPLAIGHDPGFTHPIFLTDYTAGRQTSDCRYSVPAGLVVVPDVSCETSFSSKVIRNRLEMSKSLEAAANVEGGGWGFKFSASASYKKSVAQLSSGEFLYIISQAQCRYYFSKMDVTDPPPFHPGFVNWAKRLSNSDVNENDIIEFVKYYGTHYVSEVTFGARYMKNRKVSQTKYEEFRTKKISVEAQASYSVAFSIRGGFSMDSAQKEAVSNFQKSVETNTITVGAAPPSNGDAMTWASSVQENPVPITYSLSAIHNLFTERYSKHLAEVNIGAVRGMLVNASKNYCQALKKEGRVDSCDDDIHLEISLQGVGVTSFGYRYLKRVDEAECRAVCQLEEECVAVQYTDGQGCKLLDTSLQRKLQVKTDYTKLSNLVVFLSRLQREKKNFILHQVKVKAKQQRREELQAANSTTCSSCCVQDAFCQAFVFCNPVPGSWCENAKVNCLLYSKLQMSAVEKDEHSEMHFVWKDYNKVTEKKDCRNIK